MKTGKNLGEISSDLAEWVNEQKNSYIDKSRTDRTDSCAARPAARGTDRLRRALENQATLLGHDEFSLPFADMGELVAECERERERLRRDRDGWCARCAELQSEVTELAAECAGAMADDAPKAGTVYVVEACDVGENGVDSRYWKPFAAFTDESAAYDYASAMESKNLRTFVHDSAIPLNPAPPAGSKRHAVWAVETGNTFDGNVYSSTTLFSSSQAARDYIDRVKAKGMVKVFAFGKETVHDSAEED